MIAAIVVISVGVSAFLISGTTTTLAVQTTDVTTNSTTSAVETTFADTANSTLGLELSLSINSTTIETGQAINVSLSLQNTLPRINNVSADWNWALSSLLNFSYSILPCPRWDTFRVFNGYYSQSNISSAAPLYLWPIAEGYPSCPFWNFSTYIFQPSSSTVNVSSTFPSNYDNSFSTAENQSLTGYYLPNQGTPGSNKFPPPTPFPVGVYTIAVGDEWGQLHDPPL